MSIILSDGSGCRVIGTGSGIFLTSNNLSWLLAILLIWLEDELNDTEASSNEARVWDLAKLTCLGLKPRILQI